MPSDPDVKLPVRLAALPLALGLSLLPGLAVADDDPPNADPKRVAQAYKAWTYQSCQHRSSCGADFARAAGIRVYDPYMTNPRDNVPNPDPAWIPGWSQLATGQQSSRATDALLALHLGATRKTWLAACDARYAQVAPELDARLEAARQGITAATALPTYPRLAALLALPMRGTSGAKPFTLGNDAAAFEVEAAIVAAFKALGRDDVYAKLDLGKGHRDVLPRVAAPLEHDAFCRYAMDKGDPTVRGDAALPPLPTYDDRSRGAAAVRPVIAPARAGELAADLAARQATAKTALEVGPGAADVHLLAPTAEIKSFKVTGTRAVITLVFHSDYNVGFDRCVNGYGLRVPCPTTRVIEDTTTTVTFADWPAGVKLAKGDRFTMLGRETKRTRKGSNTKVTWTIAVEGLFLIDVTQGGKQTSLLRPTAP